jgi:hypothetical protein
MQKMIAMAMPFLCACLLAGAKPGQADEKPQIAFQTLNAGEMVFLSAVDGKNLRVKIFAPTSGWIAVGFDPSFMMKGANFIIGYAKNGQAVLEDQFGVSSVHHQRDVDLGGKDDILEKAASVLPNGTEISFTIPLDSGDPYDKKLEAGKTYTIILAYGNTTDIDKRHKKKYTADLKL